MATHELLINLYLIPIYFAWIVWFNFMTEAVMFKYVIKVIPTNYRELKTRLLLKWYNVKEMGFRLPITIFLYILTVVIFFIVWVIMGLISGGLFYILIEKLFYKSKKDKE